MARAPLLSAANTQESSAPFGAVGMAGRLHAGRDPNGVATAAVSRFADERSAVPAAGSVGQRLRVCCPARLADTFSIESRARRFTGRRYEEWPPKGTR